MEKNNNQFQNAIKYLMALTAFLLPLFFLPITLEKFEFNKLSLLMLVTGGSLILWTIQVIKDKGIKVAKTPFNLPGLLFLLVVLLSAVFSIDKTSSIFGRQGRWVPSLLSFATLGIFFLTLTSNIKTKEDIKMIFYTFITGTTLATLIGILSYYGIKIIPDSGNLFNPTGALLTLGILAVLASTAAFYELLKGESTILKAFSGIVLLLNVFQLALYNKPITWILLAASLGAVFLTTKSEEIKERKLEVLAAGIIATVVLGLTLTPLTKPIIIRQEYPAAVQLNIGESWDIAISAMRDFPLLGTGPSTFYLNYPRYRSAFMNQTDYWNTRFDKPFNEALLVVGTLGILGILFGAYLDLEIIKTALKNLRETGLKQVLAIISLLLLATMFVTSATVLTSFTFVLFLALLAGAINVEQGRYLTFSTEETKEGALSLIDTADENKAFLTVLMVLPLVTLAGLEFFSLYKVYPSEYYMQQAMETLNQDAGKSMEYQARAIRHNPNRSDYYNTYAQTNLALAINLSQQEKLTDTQQEGLQNLISSAIRATKISTETVNSLNPLNWEIRAEIYKAIRGAAEDSDKWAIQALQNAMQLDPNNPRLRVDLGGIYFAQEDYLTAANYFRQATNLKADYANAYYNFAQAVKKLENYPSAKRALELTLNLIPQDSKDYTQVQKEIDELEELIAQTQPAEETKPTVEELEQQAEVQEAEEITKQEPLTVEGEEEQVVETFDEGDQAEEEAEEEQE